MTADATGISDQDGTDNASFAYQWLADSDAYHRRHRYLVPPDCRRKGQRTITVTVSFTDDEGNEEALTSVGH